MRFFLKVHIDLVEDPCVLLHVCLWTAMNQAARRDLNQAGVNQSNQLHRDPTEAGSLGVHVGGLIDHQSLWTSIQRHRISPAAWIKHLAAHIIIIITAPGLDCVSPLIVVSLSHCVCLCLMLWDAPLALLDSWCWSFHSPAIHHLMKPAVHPPRFFIHSSQSPWSTTAPAPSNWAFKYVFVNLKVW